MRKKSRYFSSLNDMMGEILVICSHPISHVSIDDHIHADHQSTEKSNNKKTCLNQSAQSLLNWLT